MRMATNGASARWLLGILGSIVLMGGAGWMTFVQNQIGAVQADQKKADEKAAAQREDTGIIKEQVQQLRKGQERQERQQEDVGRKLDELLRRSR